jgi:hypothetical protein
MVMAGEDVSMLVVLPQGPGMLQQIRSLTDIADMTRLLHECIAYERSIDGELETLLSQRQELEKSLGSLYQSAEVLEVYGQVKGQCSNAIEMFIGKLEMCFQNSELMNALSIIYPQFCMHLDATISFSFHFGILKKHYRELKNVKLLLLESSKLLNANILDLQMSMFKLIVKTQAPKTMAESLDVNPMTKLWTLINNNGLPTQRLGESLKLVEIAIILGFEFVKDERTFSTLTFRQIVELIKGTFGHNCAHVCIRVLHSKKLPL